LPLETPAPPHNSAGAKTLSLFLSNSVWSVRGQVGAQTPANSSDAAEPQPNSAAVAMRQQRQNSIPKRKSGLREAILEAEAGFGMAPRAAAPVPDDGPGPVEGPTEEEEAAGLVEARKAARRQELKAQVGNAQKNREALLRQAAMSAALSAGMYGEGPAVPRSPLCTPRIVHAKRWALTHRFAAGWGKHRCRQWGGAAARSL